ncbi:hypothetical protein SUGI_0784590 [Cryptomeria japonica]|uniref:F-box/LRR-repeat protein 3 isoform X2 n=1 Tax=Cryptomeria japonica TaxID=3369 RepID=UPI002414A8DD|nr:F-box/LRR-repeat protein 3 isoform X2 [Cryptomeria japonica]GLJ38502.1 hypothetical protein SUGI_0784590 [Cryptomeria japonica]
MKRAAVQYSSIMGLLDDEILLTILEKLQDPTDRKSWCLVSKHFFSLEARSRKTVQLMRSQLLPRILQRYNKIQHLDLSLCSQMTDESLGHVARLIGNRLLSINLSKLWTFTHFGIAQLVQRCQSLVEVDLSNCTEFTDYTAEAIAHAQNLKSLKLVKCKQITDMGLGCIAVGCNKLQTLNLKWCVGVTDLGVELVAVKCKELRNLDLSYLQITNKCLESLTRLCHLENLALVGCVSVGDKGLIYLKNKSLQGLDVSKCRNISSTGIINLASVSPELRQLTLAYCIPITSDLANSQTFDRLQIVKFDGCKISSTALASVGRSCKYLRELSLSKCIGVTDEELKGFLTYCRELNKLDLTCCCDLTDVALSAVAMSCRYLSSLKIESCHLVTEKSLTMLGEGCPFLEELDLTDCSINNTGLESLSRCSELITLKLGFCPNISDEGIIQIGACCSNLQELDLYRSTGVGDAGMVAISNGCPRLKSINLSYCTCISDDALKAISRLRKLHNLEIRGCSGVSSAGLSAIALGCKRIAELDIKRCYRVDDAGILAIADSCQNLRQVNFSYCPVSDVGLSAVASLTCLQNMKLVHLRNVTVNGFVSTLLACESLKKLKLLECLKFKLPRALIKRLEAHGCTIRWMDKPFVM